MKQDGTNVKEVRVTQPIVVKQIMAEQREGGDRTATQAIQRVMTEYLTLKKMVRPARRRKNV